MFEDCCKFCNDENIPEVGESTEDVFEDPFQENIHLHQEASPSK